MNLRNAHAQALQNDRDGAANNALTVEEKKQLTERMLARHATQGTWFHRVLFLFNLRPCSDVLRPLDIYGLELAFVHSHFLHAQ
jgi:hypothetical protein